MDKHLFFRRIHEQGYALSFDDVLLRPGKSTVPPAKVNVNTKFSRNVPLLTPLGSAAMDTVTESPKAIAMAKSGGIGILHRKLLPTAQALEVHLTKTNLNGLIAKPVCVRDTMRVEEVDRMRAQMRYSFHSFPVVNRYGKLVGMLAKDDFEFCDSPRRTVGEIMTAKSLITGDLATTLNDAYRIMKAKRKKTLPLLENSRVVGMYVWSDLKRIKLGNVDGYNIDNEGQLRVGAAVGTGKNALIRANLLVEAGVDVLVIDTAHGDSDAVYKTLRTLKRLYPHVDVVAGNISDGDSAKRLVDAGADGIKVGQGAGSTCTTRIISGAGSPQVSAVYECAEAIADTDVPVISDGGKRFSGHITVALAAGAHSVMLGRMLAGTDESPGEIITINGNQYKVLRGMGSLGVMEESAESRDRYGQRREVGKDKLVPEGVEGLVPYQGSVEKLVFQYIGGLRAGMGYVGAASIEELRQKARFHRITPGGLAESHPHDIIITKDAPNYRRDELRLAA